MNVRFQKNGDENERNKETTLKSAGDRFHSILPSYQKKLEERNKNLNACEWECEHVYMLFGIDLCFFSVYAHDNDYHITNISTHFFFSSCNKGYRPKP